METRDNSDLGSGEKNFLRFVVRFGSTLFGSIRFNVGSGRVILARSHFGSVRCWFGSSRFGSVRAGRDNIVSVRRWFVRFGVTGHQSHFGSGDQDYSQNYQE